MDPKKGSPDLRHYTDERVEAKNRPRNHKPLVNAYVILVVQYQKLGSLTLFLRLLELP